jgi:hypothetical protein
VEGRDQTSGVSANDFTNQVTYTVTSESGSSRAYNVTVTVQKSPDKEITDFAFRKSENLGLESDIAATISGTDISLTLPYGKDSLMSSLVAFYSTNGEGVTVDGTDQKSADTSNDFTSSKTYHVTAEDGSRKTTR